MKNQILEYDRHVGMNRTYGAVRIKTLKNEPVTVSISISKSFISFDLTLFICFSLNLLNKIVRRRRGYVGT